MPLWVFAILFLLLNVYSEPLLLCYLIFLWTWWYWLVMTRLINGAGWYTFTWLAVVPLVVRNAHKYLLYSFLAEHELVPCIYLLDMPSMCRYFFWWELNLNWLSWKWLKKSKTEVMLLEEFQWFSLTTSSSGLIDPIGFSSWYITRCSRYTYASPLLIRF